jgi:hypothetical protein
MYLHQFRWSEEEKRWNFLFKNFVRPDLDGNSNPNFCKCCELNKNDN